MDARKTVTFRGVIREAEVRATVDVVDADNRVVASVPVTVAVKRPQESILDPSAFASAFEHLEFLRTEYAERQASGFRHQASGISRSPEPDNLEPDSRPKWLNLLSSLASFLRLS